MIHRPNHSFSFLMEFIIVLFFFAVSAMICVRIFSSSVLMNQEANDKKEALEIAQNYIESNTEIECGKKELDNGMSMEIEYVNQKYPHYNVLIEKDEKQLVSIDFYRGFNYEKN